MTNGSIKKTKEPPVSNLIFFPLKSKNIISLHQFTINFLLKLVEFLLM